MIIFSKQLQYQITIFNTNNLQWYGTKYYYQIWVIFSRSIWHIDGTLTGNTSSQSGPRCNDNEGVLNTPQMSRTGASPSNAI